jgi:hypothetical protein
MPCLRAGAQVWVLFMTAKNIDGKVQEARESRSLPKALLLQKWFKDYETCSSSKMEVS